MKLQMNKAKGNCALWGSLGFCWALLSLISAPPPGGIVLQLFLPSLPGGGDRPAKHLGWGAGGGGWVWELCCVLPPPFPPSNNPPAWGTFQGRVSQGSRSKLKPEPFSEGGGLWRRRLQRAPWPASSPDTHLTGFSCCSPHPPSAQLPASLSARGCTMAALMGNWEGFSGEEQQKQERGSFSCSLKATTTVESRSTSRAGPFCHSALSGTAQGPHCWPSMLGRKGSAWC